MPVSCIKNVILLFWGHFSTLPASADLQRPRMMLKLTNDGSIGFSDHFLLWKDISHASVWEKNIILPFWGRFSTLPASADLRRPRMMLKLSKNVSNKFCDHFSLSEAILYACVRKNFIFSLFFGHFSTLPASADLRRQSHDLKIFVHLVQVNICPIKKKSAL